MPKDPLPFFRLICASLYNELTWEHSTLQPKELNWGEEGQHKGEGEVASPLDHISQLHFAFYLIFVSVSQLIPCIVREGRDATDWLSQTGHTLLQLLSSSAAS